MNLVDVKNRFDNGLTINNYKKYFVWFTILFLILLFISSQVFASASIDVNITKTYATLADSNNIIKYMLGGAILIFFLAIFYINIIHPKKTVYVDD